MMAQVPPMPRAKTKAVIEGELGGAAIEDVFEFIDLENVLGSASIAQVGALCTVHTWKFVCTAGYNSMTPELQGGMQWAWE